MNAIEMPVDAYYCLLRSVPCTEPLLMPRHRVTNDNAAEKYALARDLWLERGWVQPDFDGRMRLSAELARGLYNVSHMRFAIRWRRSGMTDHLVQGPADFLWVREENGQVRLDMQRSFRTLGMLRQALERDPSGQLDALRAADGRRETAVLSGDLEQDRRALERCLGLMLAEEVHDA